MKIELKNIHHSEQLSQETNAFSATLYINDIKAGTATNQGHGGPTDYYGLNDRGNQLIREAEEYCKTLPPEKFTVGDKEYTLESNLEGYIDDLLTKHLQQKDLQKFRRQADRAMEKSILVGIPDHSFRTLTFKMPIGMLLVHPNGPNILRDVIATKVIPNFKEGEQILNTNIPEKVFKDAGLTAKQYAIPSETKPLKKNIQKKKGRGI
jgi:hypothetical protein